uniref:Cytochrome P450 E-class, group I n=1 Tax=Podospora anserina (strain S / ATCC MYA-4624 / DSM 980 / FGSC 10383) TaxID=515849 RepID=A0A090CVN4_PODAN|nr:Putative cytochrome P450 E-class, group I [Podospora anserina S mat+]
MNSVADFKEALGQVPLTSWLKFSAGLYLVYHIVRAIYLLNFHPYAKYPGPKWAALSNTWYMYQWFKGRYPWSIEAALKKYGDVVRIAPNEIVFFTVQAQNDILLSGTKGKPAFRKSSFYFKIGPHTGLAAESDPEKHRTIRKWMAPAFSPRALKEQDPVLHGVVDKAINKMAQKGDTPEGMDLTIWSDWIACDLAGSLGYGYDFGNIENEKDADLLRWFNAVTVWVTMDQAFKRLGPFVHPLVYLILPRSLVKLLRKHKKIVANRVENAKDFKQRDYFTSFIQEGKSMPNTNMDWILAQANHIFIGGLDPDTNLFWSAILFLAQHPDKFRKFAAEIRGKFKRYEDIEDEELTHLPWLSGVIDESLRLHTNGSFGQPRVSPGATVDGHYVPKGCGVQTSIFAAFHSERYWHKPHDFCPERWLPATHSDYDPAFAKDVRECFRPFSAGTRSCIGQNMGYRQARILFAKMAWKLDWEVVNPHEFHWERDLRLYATWVRPHPRIRYKLSDVAKAAAAEGGRENGEKLVEV